MSLQINEWPQKIIHKVHTRMFDIAIEHRSISGCVMIPSPDPEAHVRFTDGNSLHCVGADGLGMSHAGDFFGRNDQADKMWAASIANERIGGVGIYFDTHLNGERRAMYHFDDFEVRKAHVWWVCPNAEKREYIYYHKDPLAYLRALADGLESLRG